MQSTKASLQSLVEELTAIAAPSGNEDRMIARVRSELRAYGLEPEVDSIGNVTVTLGSGSPSLLLFAHLDQLGLVVRAIEADGFLRVERLGGVPERVLPGCHVRIHGAAGDLAAVVGLKAHHLTPSDEKYVAQPVGELYLDAGFASAEQALEAGVRVGDPVTYAGLCTSLAGARLAGPSMDDRVAVAALLQLLPRLVAAPPPLTVHLGFSVQEEFNVRGTLALAARLEPELAVQLDVAPAADTPDLRGFTPVRLGGGPVLTRLSFHGRGTLGGLVPHPAVLAGLERAALSAGVQVQRQAIVGLITDASFLPMATPRGIAAAEVAIPVRYTHSPVETVQLSDIAATVELLESFVRGAAGLDLSRGKEG
jgi:putative aminopeptidase FrvX